MNRLNVDSSRLLAALLTKAIAMIILLCCSQVESVRAQTPNLREAEGLVARQVGEGQDVDLKKREISADFLAKLLESYKPPANKPSRGIYLSNAVISGDFYFERMTVPYWLILEDCTFEGNVSFAASTFNQGLSLRGGVFKGAANFYQVWVQRDLRINKATFAGKDKEINFDNINVSGVVQLYETKFGGPFTLANSEMRGLECTKAKFGNDADFYSIRVNGDASFTDSSFDGAVNFGSIDIGKNLELTQVRFNNPSKTIEFFSMRVGGNSVFNRTEFIGGFNLSKATVDGTLELNETRAKSASATKSFSGMKVDTLIFVNAAIASPYDLGGADYRALHVTSGQRDASLDLIKASTFSRDNYTNLEAYYRGRGLEEAADDVYVAGEARERDEKFSQQGIVNLPGYILSWIIYLLAGYGKRKELALVWSLALIVFGYLVFRKEEYMEVQKPEDPSRYKGRYHPVWYSIALFLPIVDLEDKKIWAPKIKRRKSRFYMRLHIILGYLLIPIGLAAWAGLIR